MQLKQAIAFQITEAVCKHVDQESNLDIVLMRITLYQSKLDFFPIVAAIDAFR